jgi:hypothetical protein
MDSPLGIGLEWFYQPENFLVEGVRFSRFQAINVYGGGKGTLA